MSLGVGIDIISIDRIKDSLLDSGEVFLKKVFTEWEMSRAQEHPLPASYYAKLFAAKEAIFKLFAIGWETGVSLTEIEIREGPFGEPLPHLYGKFLKIMQSRGGSRILLSLSYENELAVAVAILE